MNNQHKKEAISIINRAANELKNKEFEMEFILIGWMQTVVEEDRQHEMYRQIEEVLPEYFSTSLKERLLRNSISLN